VGSFCPREYEDVPAYIACDAAAGQLVSMGLFVEDLQHWDDLLTGAIDALVAVGYLRWTVLPGLGEQNAAWERWCTSP
jgi:hypothetical protein